MFIREIIFVTLIANILATASSNELSDQGPYEYLARDVTITVKSEHLDDSDESLLSILSQDDEASIVKFPYLPEKNHITEDINDEDIQDRNGDETLIEESPYGNASSSNFTADSEDLITDRNIESQVANETLIEETYSGNDRTGNFTTAEENLTYNGTFVSELNTTTEASTLRNKRETSKVNLDDISAIVTVVNKEVGIEMTFYIKKAFKVVKGQRYSCRIGLREDNVVIYHRCKWIGTHFKEDFSGEDIKEDKGDFFNDIANYT